MLVKREKLISINIFKINRKVYTFSTINNKMNDIKSEIRPENTKEEKIIIVDENDNPICTDTRKNMVRQLYLIIRGWKTLYIGLLIYLLLTHSKYKVYRRKQFAIQRRAMKKEYCPGFLDLVTGGVVNEGDSDIKEVNLKLTIN